MFIEKEAPKVMINGWRSKAVIYKQLNDVMEKTKDEYGNSFTKALFMDEIIRLGVRAMIDEDHPELAPVQPPATVKPNKAPIKRFVPPLESEVGNYMRSKGMTLMDTDRESSKFFDYYESNGWKVGKNPMKSWEASARNWMKNNHSSGGSRGSVDQSSFVSGGQSAIEGEVIQSQAGFLNHGQ